MTLSHRERIERVISGIEVDRSPVSLWRHFPVDDQYPEALARSTIRFQNTFDFDFVKISPSSSFCLKDWGVTDVWDGNPEGSRTYCDQPVQLPEDWLKLKPLSPRQGEISKQLKCIELVRQNIPMSTPVIQTIFSPLTQAKNLVGKSNLSAHMRLHPAEVKSALQVITNGTIKFLHECAALKIDGIFYAVQAAQYSLHTLNEFEEFGIYFDLQVLAAAKIFWFNLGHIHGVNIMFDEMSKYPVQALNWHDQETSPSLAEGKTRFSGAVCGGLRQWETLAYGTPEKVKAEALKAIRETNNSRFILGTGCVTPVIAPDSNIYAAREAVDEFKGINE